MNNFYQARYNTGWLGMYFYPEYDNDNKIIENPKIIIEPNQTLMQTLITCLHEYGHHKTYLEYKLKNKKDLNYSFGVTLIVIDYEILAWMEGWKIAKQIGIAGNRKFFKAYFESVKHCMHYYISCFVHCPERKLVK